MIFEYAIEPDLIKKWASDTRDYAEFLNEYGLGSPRLISSFPKQKGNKLRSYLLNNGPENQASIASRRYTEMVEMISESVIRRDVHSSAQSTWTELLEVENGRVPFDRVLSEQVVGVDGNVTLNAMYETDSLWRHKNQAVFSRTNMGLYSVISNLVRFSTETIVVVDPYGWTSDSIEFIRFLIRETSKDRPNTILPKIKLFFKKSDRSALCSHIKSEVLKGGTGGVEFNVVELTEHDESEVFHNRCVMSEHGGVVIGHGISIKNRALQTDEAFLMQPELYEKKWDQFVERCCFAVASEA